MSDKVFDALTLLAACLCKEASDDGDNPLCFCDVAPGDGVAHDYGFGESCGDAEGMAWVRLITSYPSTTPGQISEQPCGNSTGIEVELGILRPYFVQEEGIDSEIARAAVVGQYADMAKMRRAIMCCDAYRSKDILLGSYTPVGPAGGAFGGMYTFAAVL